MSEYNEYFESWWNSDASKLARGLAVNLIYDIAGGAASRSTEMFKELLNSTWESAQNDLYLREGNSNE